MNNNVSSVTLHRHEDEEDESSNILEEISRVQHFTNEPEVEYDRFPSGSSISLPSQHYGTSNELKHNSLLITSNKLFQANKPHKLQRNAVISNAFTCAISVLLIILCIILPFIPFYQFIDISTTYYVTSFMIVFLPVCVVLFVTSIIGMITFKTSKDYIKSLHIGYICSLLFIVFLNSISIAIMFISTEPNYHFNSYLSLSVSVVVLNILIATWSTIMIVITIIRMRKESFEYQYGKQAKPQVNLLI